MIGRRVLIAGVILGLGAVAATAQGKKGASGNDIATPGEIAVIAGNYHSYGLNTDGSSYEQTASIVQQGDAVEFTWSNNGDTLRGDGVIEGRLVTVDWGDDTPVFYVIMPDGTLHGTWADGLALEKLTPQ